MQKLKGGFSKDDKDDLLKTNIMHNCLKLWNGKEMPQYWKTGYLPCIKEKSKSNSSIIVSKEVLSFTVNYAKHKESKLQIHKQFWNDFTLSTQSYQLHTLITYRNFFDWIYSYYTQQHKFFDRPRMPMWLEGGISIPSPKEHATKNLKDPEEYSKINQKDTFHIRKHFPDKLVETFSSMSSLSFKIMNMDAVDDVKKLFFCDGLPSSLRMCNLVDKLSYSLNENKAPDNLWCNMLATKAHEAGHILSKKNQKN
jgi:hypothetical protein